jgi:type VI protein secretion system component Hcp
MDPVEASQQAIFDSGTAVGEVARQRFPNGQLVDEDYTDHTQAVRTTLEALADHSVPALYEAAFTSERIRTRVDVLCRNGRKAFDLI